MFRHLAALSLLAFLPQSGCPSEEPPPPEDVVYPVKLTVDGWWTNPNPIGTRMPRGALRVADDIVIDRPSVATPRRASDVVEAPGSGPGFVIDSFLYSGESFVWNGDELFQTTIGPTASYASAGGIQYSGSTQLRHATAQGDLYVVSDLGPLVLDGVGAQLQLPGAPVTPDLYQPNLVAESTGWLGDGEVVAYKVLFGRNDNEGRAILGEPSGRAIVRADASGGPFVVDVEVYRPSTDVTATSGHFFQILRTRNAPTGVDPGDTYFLVYEAPWTISGEQLTVRDIAPAGDTPLYTNPDQGGLRNSNVRPPIAKDMATFRDRLWLANTTAKHTMRLRLIAPPVPSDGYSVQIGADGYVLDTPADPGASISVKIEAAARYLVSLINLTGDDLVATYASGAYDPPGIIQITSREFNVPFSATPIIGGAACGALFEPNITGGYDSAAQVVKNRIHYSKFGEPYGFPLGNTLEIGAEEYGIARIFALRDTLFVVKEKGGDGLWKVTGNGPFYAEQVNASVQLLAEGAVAVVNNTGYLFTTMGLVSVSESGAVDIVSVPLENILRDAILANDFSSARIIARESNTEQKVYLGLNYDEDFPQESWVWNVSNPTWTRDTRPWQAGHVDATGRLILYDEVNGANPLVERYSGNQAADTLGVPFVIGWNTDTAGIPNTMKQFFDVAVLYEESQADDVTVDMRFFGDGGESEEVVTTGGDGTPYVRAEVPFDTQQTSRLGIQVEQVATGVHNVVGITTRYRVMGAVKGP